VLTENAKLYIGNRRLIQMLFSYIAIFMVLLRPWMLENQLMWPINIIDRPRLEIRKKTLAVWSSDGRAAQLPGATRVWRRASIVSNVFKKENRIII